MRKVKGPEPVLARYLEVRPKDGEPAERLIRRFTKKVRADGILSEVYDRKGYLKPSIRRRRKSARARFIRKVEERAQQEKK